MLLDGEIDIAPISVDRVRAQRRPPADPAAPLRLVRGRRRLDPARHADAARPGALGRGDAGERDLGRARRGSCCPKAEIVPLGDGGRRDAPHRRRGAAAARSRIRRRTTTSAGSGSSGPGCRWCSPSGPRPSRSSTGSSSSSTRSSRRCGSPARSPSGSRYEASERYGYPPGFLARYFEKLRYSFGPRERAGLYTFLEMARDVGELAPRARAALRRARRSPA